MILSQRGDWVWSDILTRLKNEAHHLKDHSYIGICQILECFDLKMWNKIAQCGFFGLEGGVSDHSKP